MIPAPDPYYKVVVTKRRFPVLFHPWRLTVYFVDELSMEHKIGRLFIYRNQDESEIKRIAQEIIEPYEMDQDLPFTTWLPYGRYRRL